MRSRFISVFVCLLVLFNAASAQERYVKPVDEAAQDASFLAFRKKLISAAEKKDSAHILSVIDTKIELSFGGDAGIADFKRIWKITQKNSPFWSEFLAVIKNGGAFDGKGRNKYGAFAAPYTHSSWPEDIDGFEYMAIFGSNVNLREKPSADAAIVAQLSYNIVKPNDDESVKRKTGKHESDYEYEWIKVETLGGKSGFVKAEFARSPIDYRAGFEKKRGVWKMTYFIAGD